MLKVGSKRRRTKQEILDSKMEEELKQGEAQSYMTEIE